MFEESRSFAVRTGTSPDPAGGAAERSHAAQPIRSEPALKAVEWNDLIARLEAARELRLALRYEARHPIEDTRASFSDAAAHYFRALDGYEQTINPDDLNRHNGSAPIVSGDNSSAAADTTAPRRQTSLPRARDDAKEEQ
ncbi:MAG: hypothetical protein ACXIT4_02800 [Erythrobacter sp.]